MKRSQKKKGQGASIRQKFFIQFNPSSGNNTIKFIKEPLSNVDLLHWVRQLGGIFSRDNLPSSIRQKECVFFNLGSQIGSGTHWVCYRNLEKYCEYFHSFGLKMPFEVKKHLTTGGKKIMYSIDEIQERNSVLCGYWCLYYVLERQEVRPILDVIHNTRFSFTVQVINHQFLIR